MFPFGHWTIRDWQLKRNQTNEQIKENKKGNRSKNPDNS